MMDKPTPERAIELARRLDVCHPAAEINNVSLAEVKDILRDYADLRRKWDAVVNAEPFTVSEIFSSDFSCDGALLERSDKIALSIGDKLIIKPE